MKNNRPQDSPRSRTRYTADSPRRLAQNERATLPSLLAHCPMLGLPVIDPEMLRLPNQELPWSPTSTALRALACRPLPMPPQPALAPPTSPLSAAAIESCRTALTPPLARERPAPAAAARRPAGSRHSPAPASHPRRGTLARNDLRGGADSVSHGFTRPHRRTPHASAVTTTCGPHRPTPPLRPPPPAAAQGHPPSSSTHTCVLLPSTSILFPGKPRASCIRRCLAQTPNPAFVDYSSQPNQAVKKVAVQSQFFGVPR